jgi:EF hand
MRRQVLVIGISFAVVALSGVPHEAAAQTQQATQAGQTQQIQPEGGMMGGGMMGGDPMHGGMRGQQRGPIGTGMMMRMMFSLMDADGDGSISLQEFQAAHERIFKGMDQNKDGRLTMEEMQSFMGGGTGR